MPTPSSPHVALRCDASPRIGVGHLVRCLALADGLLARGWSVTLVGSVTGIPWVEDEVHRRGLQTLDAPDDPATLAALVDELGCAAVVLDGYHLDRATGAALRSRGTVVLAVVDGTWGADQEADLYLDQNLDAGPVDGPQVPPGAGQLLGLPHVLFRDSVLDQRRDRPEATARPPRVLTVFGGTDAQGAAPVVVPLVLATGLPVHVVAIAATDDLATALRPVADAGSLDVGAHLEVRSPTPDLAALAAGCDLVVTAAGTSVWELLCLGVPAALVRVAENQRVGYDAVIGRDVAVGLGSLDGLRDDEAAREHVVATLRDALTDPEGARRRADAGQALVDGRGRDRVVEALERAVAAKGAVA